MEKVKMGIIGTGNIARWHVPGYLRHERAEIAAVCDINKETAENCARLWGVKKTYTDYHDLLKDNEVDAVDILLPHHLHATITVEAAEAGKHIAVQKPMALNIRDTDKMISAARKANVKLMLEECEVFYPPHVKAKELIESGEVGEPSFIRIGYKHARGQELRVSGPPRPGLARSMGLVSWRRDPRQFGGGHFFTAGHHKFAVARYLLGEIKEVRAWIDDIFKPNRLPLIAMWRYVTKGRYGFLDYTFSPKMHIKSDMGALGELLEVTGSSGMIWIARCEAQILKVAPLILYRGTYPGESVYFDNLKSDYIESFIGMTHHFVDCILEDKEPLIGGEEGKKILQFNLAVYKSAEENGKAVNPQSITDWTWPWERDPSLLEKIDMSYEPATESA